MTGEFKRKPPTLRDVVQKAARGRCDSGICGDGWNSYDCVVCMAKAYLRQERKQKRKEREGFDSEATTN